jgi:hypothetical protein
MKGDAFLEMAARCGDLPDSVMAVPGLEYVGEKSAEWEALCIKAAGWGGRGPGLKEEPSAEEEAQWREWATKRTTIKELFLPLIGLALFARLMAIVTREE